MMQKAIIFDLDDTLIDTKYRHYQVLCSYLKNYNTKIEPLSYNEYLIIRSKYSFSNENIIKTFYPDNDGAFTNYWNSNIETTEFLKYDQPIANVNLLQKLRNLKSLDFLLLSLRSNKQSAQNQFMHFDFSHLFTEVHFLMHSEINSKSILIEDLKTKYEILYFIGDTPGDRIASIENDIVFYSVESGFRPMIIENSMAFININNVLDKLIYDYEK